MNRASATLACALLTACATQEPRQPREDIPQTFENSASAEARWPGQDWYREFGSSELDDLVEQAVRNNSDINAARARVSQADARARQARSAILPALEATGNGNYLAGHSSQGGGHEFDRSAMLSASYEVDFWGRTRATARSAGLLSAASRADRDSIALTTLAGVANGYFQLLALRERTDVAESNLAVARQLLAVVQARVQAAVASPIDLATQQAALDTAQLAVLDLQQTAFESRTALSLLLGRLPENFDVKGQPLDSLSEPSVSAGLPSELLTRRPDILAAESNLRAGHADLLAARAALLPSLSLTAAGGIQNPALPATVLTIPGIGPSLALGTNLVQPIFDRGRLRAQRDEVEARNLELLSNYRNAIVSAFNDVENALGAIQHLDQAREFQIGNLAESERAFQGAKLRYQAGSADFLTLLEAQRSLYAARDQFIQYKLARLQARVSLCKALGGGWTKS